jgi:hypothetical protein
VQRLQLLGECKGLAMGWLIEGRHLKVEMDMTEFNNSIGRFVYYLCLNVVTDDILITVTVSDKTKILWNEMARAIVFTSRQGN